MLRDTSFVFNLKRKTEDVTICTNYYPFAVNIVQLTLEMRTCLYSEVGACHAKLLDDKSLMF